jgi:hypothetical protein
VNVAELEPQIAACNLSLREIESELNEKDVVWNSARLEPLLDRLKTVVLRSHDLGLVRGAVPKAERSDVTELESPKSAIAEFAARVVAARDRVNDPKSAGDAERKAELKRLDEISRRLGEIEGK